MYVTLILLGYDIRYRFIVNSGAMLTSVVLVIVLVPVGVVAVAVVAVEGCHSLSELIYLLDLVHIWIHKIGSSELLEKWVYLLATYKPTHQNF